MFEINEDLSIYVTRGDAIGFAVTADDNGRPYLFKAGDVVRITVTQKKNCANVMLQKDFPVEEETESVNIILSEQDTKFGDIISKPVDYWYEIELNPFTDPRTIIGYDDDGAKIFRLFPEGGSTYEPPTEEVPVVDSRLDLTSTRPVQNQAVARAMVKLDDEVTNKVTNLMAEVEKSIDNSKLYEEVNTLKGRIENLSRLEQGSTTADAELMDIRVGHDGKIYSLAGEAVREQFRNLKSAIANIRQDDVYYEKVVEVSGEARIFRVNEDFVAGDEIIFKIPVAYIEDAEIHGTNKDGDGVWMIGVNPDEVEPVDGYYVIEVVVEDAWGSIEINSFVDATITTKTGTVQDLKDETGKAIEALPIDDMYYEQPATSVKYESGEDRTFKVDEDYVAGDVFLFGFKTALEREASVELAKSDGSHLSYSIDIGEVASTYDYYAEEFVIEEGTMSISVSAVVDVTISKKTKQGTVQDLKKEVDELKKHVESIDTSAIEEAIKSIDGKVNDSVRKYFENETIVFDSVKIVDELTGVRYALKVSNGNLTMSIDEEEVTE